MDLGLGFRVRAWGSRLKVGAEGWDFCAMACNSGGRGHKDQVGNLIRLSSAPERLDDHFSCGA